MYYDSAPFKFDISQWIWKNKKMLLSIYLKVDQFQNDMKVVFVAFNIKLWYQDLST